MQVVELGRLMKALGQQVLTLALRQRIIAGPAAGKGDDVAMHVADRNAQAIAHHGLAVRRAERELEGVDDGWRQATVDRVGMLACWLELGGEAGKELGRERLVD